MIIKIWTCTNSLNSILVPRSEQAEEASSNLGTRLLIQLNFCRGKFSRTGANRENCSLRKIHTYIWYNTVPWVGQDLFGLLYMQCVCNYPRKIWIYYGSLVQELLQGHTSLIPGTKIHIQPHVYAYPLLILASQAPLSSPALHTCIAKVQFNAM